MATSELDDLKSEIAHLKQRLLEVEKSVAITQADARHYDKLKTFETLAGSVVHKFGTALNIVTGYAHLIQESPDQTSDVKEMATAMHQQAENVTRLIRRLLQFGAAGAPGPNICNLSTITKDTSDLFFDFAKSRGVTLTFSSNSPDALVAGDAHLLSQAIAAMLRCILEKMPKGSVVVDINNQDHSTTKKEGELKDCHVLSITLQPHSGQPSSKFADLDSTNRANSLPYPEIRGLGVSREIVQDYGGWITIDWLFPQGPTILTYFPKQAPI